jgi:hypothetical protein
MSNRELGIDRTDLINSRFSILIRVCELKALPLTDIPSSPFYCIVITGRASICIISAGSNANQSGPCSPIYPTIEVVTAIAGPEKSVYRTSDGGTKSDDFVPHRTV